MALVWKNNEAVNQIKTVIKNSPPRAFVEKIEKRCDYNNFQTSGYKNKLIKKLNKIEIKIIIEILEKYCYGENEFTIKDLINYQNANNLTDGSLQRKVLGILVCNGIVKKEIVPYIDKKGKQLFCCKYKFVPLFNRKICPYINNKEKCIYNWKKAKETRYFSEPETQ